MAKSTSLIATPTNRLSEALKAGGRRSDWLAKKTGYSIWHISRVANGHLEPSPLFIRMVSAALDLPASYLFPDQAA